MRAPWLAALTGAILGLAGSAGPPAAAAPEPVKVRAAAHPGFGRLVFEWPAPVTVDSHRDGERLTLRFAQPFAADLGGVLNAIGDYLVGLDRGGDPREVVLRLAPETVARIDTDDDRVVVDLMPGTAAAPVRVRTGWHGHFLRVVLDWARPIDFMAEADGTRLRIRFGRAASIDAAMIGERGQRLLDAAVAHAGDRWSELRLILKTGVWAQVYKLEDRLVVIDLYQPSQGALGAGPLAMLPGRAPRPPEPVRPASTPPETPPPEPARLASTPSGTTRPDAAPAAAEAPAPAAAPASERPPVALQIAATEVGRGLALDFVWSHPIAAAFLVRAGYLWSVFAGPAAAEVLPSLASPAPGWLGPGEQIDAVGGTALRFSLRRPLAARVERVEGRWRVVLGATAAPPEAARLERLADPARLRIVTGEAAHLVHLADPEVGDRLDFWPLLTPGLGEPRAQRLVDLELLATAQGLAWRPIADPLRAATVDGAVDLLAPEGLHLSADTLASPRPLAEATEPPPAPAPVAPAGSPAASSVEPQVAVSPTPPPAEPPLTEPAAAPTDAPGRKSSPSGPAAPLATQRPAVATAEPAPSANGPAAAVPREPTGSPLGLARFAPATSASMIDQRVLWQQRVVNAPANERPAARLDLARFFLAHARSAEALAALGAGADEAPAGAAPEIARRSLTGAAQFLMDRPDQAAAALEAPVLDGDPEAALWRAVLAGARADWSLAAEELARSGTTLADYPRPLQLRLGLPAARIALEAGNRDAADRLLGWLQALKPGPVERDRVAFVAGLALARRGAIDDAERIWRGLEQSQDYQTRIEAGFARVQMLLDAGRLSPAQALARLVAVRPLWRPHPQELAMLDALARLYLQNDEPSAALHIWQDVLSHFPGSPETARIAKAMRDGFVAALLPADGGGIGALRAYALYREFPELAPDGALGDQLHQRLASQLAGLDLIEQAAGLLDPLLDHLQAPAKAETGAELAELWLRAPDPAAALAALDRTETKGGVPQALSLQRRMLRARALAASDRPDAALALLEGGADPAQRRLRAEILWRQRDWPRLIGALEELLPARAGPDGPLAEADRDLVIRLVVAYARQGQVRALEGLRRRFGAAMHGQTSEPAFLMATLPAARAGGLEELDPALAAADEQLGRVRAYLETIRPAP